MDQIKLIITDIALKAKTANLIVAVVTDKASIYESLVEEYGELRKKRHPEVK